MAVDDQRVERGGSLPRAARPGCGAQDVDAEARRLLVERTRGFLDGMISALEHRDTETQWHSRRVSLFSRRIGEAVGLDPVELDTLEQGALLHDIGKMGVSDSILRKRGPLTAEEWVEMRLHPEIGFRMLSKIPYLRDAATVVLQHQERWDGEGYPHSLRGESIVLGARIFCIADTMDAITADRPYRKGRPLHAAKAEIRRCSGTQFDPALVAAYLAIPDQTWSDVRDRVEALEAESSAASGAPAN